MSIDEGNEDVLPDSHNPHAPSIQAIPPEIRLFLESIIKDAELTVNKEIYEEVIGTLYEQLDLFLTHKLIDELSVEDLEIFTEMVEQGGSSAEIQEFLGSHIPNASEIFANAFIAFRNLYLESDEDEVLKEYDEDIELTPQEQIVAFLKIHTPNIREAFREIYQRSLIQ